MQNIGKWLYFLGLLIAIVTGLLGFSAVWLGLILVVIAILVGILFFDSSDIVNLGIRYMVLVAVAAAFDLIPVVGPFLTAIFTAVAAFLAPAVLTTLVVWFVKKYFLSK
jgi:hypothetical protein